MNATLERFLRNSHIFARLVEQLLEKGYLQSAAGGAVTFDQLNILKFLDRPGPSLGKDIARFLNASYAAASKAVSRLERKKLVVTETDARDRRAQIVSVTAKGRALIRAYERLKRRRLATLFHNGEMESLTEDLERGIAILLRERGVVGNPCLGCGAYYANACVVREHGQTCRCER